MKCQYKTCEDKVYLVWTENSIYCYSHSMLPDGVIINNLMNGLDITYVEAAEMHNAYKLGYTPEQIKLAEELLSVELDFAGIHDLNLSANIQMLRES